MGSFSCTRLRVCAAILGFFVVATLLVTFQSSPAWAQTHGAAAAKNCFGPLKVCRTDGDCDDGNECTADICDPALSNTMECIIDVSYNDDFNDTHTITQVYDIVDPFGTAGVGPLFIGTTTSPLIPGTCDFVNCPIVGSLPIIAVMGNTNCVPGPLPPGGCQILPPDGEATFLQDVYMVPEDFNLAASPIIDQVFAVTQDACDGIPSGGCPTFPLFASSNSQTFVEQGCDNPPLDPSEPCTDVDGNECTIAGCDGAGSCDQLHITPDSTPCGDGQLDTECSTAGCDGAGSCDPLHIPEDPSEPCTDIDGNECTMAGCDGLGFCDQGHITPDSTPCGGGALDTECSMAGCDGAGQCDPLHVLVDPSVPCTDADGNECTIAGCDGLGLCDQDHIFVEESTPCTDPGNECFDAGCDGLGTCDPEHIEVECPDDGNPCTDESCDPDTGCVSDCMPDDKPECFEQIGDCIWIDLDSDGIQDAGEYCNEGGGIGGVDIELLNCTTGATDSTQTIDGLYSFEVSVNLDTCEFSDDYQITVLDSNFDSGGPLDGLGGSPNDQGGDDSADSDCVANVIDCDKTELNDTNDCGYTVPCDLEVVKTVDPDVVMLTAMPGCEDMGKPTSLTFKYVGGGCPACDNDQNASACAGAVTDGEVVAIVSGPGHANGAPPEGQLLSLDLDPGEDAEGYTVVPSVIEPGQEFTVFPREGHDFHPHMFIQMQSSLGYQDVELRVNCSQSLELGDDFGGVVLTGYSGFGGPTNEVTYTYVITNHGALLTDLTVMDDQLGLIAEIPSIAKDQVITLTETALIDVPTTNVVTVTGMGLDGEDCVATDDAFVDVTEPLACRFTGGGNDTGQGDNYYTFGGQAGAPTAEQPQPWGEWTHHQESGDDGSFVFHGGTASAQPGTEIDLIFCSDPGWCNQARHAPAHQLNFEGVGQFNNLNDPSAPLSGAVANETFHWFEVHVEDAGEPGDQGSENSNQCPTEGNFGSELHCSCRDFYQITIYKEFDYPNEGPNKDDVIYSEYGYLDGGNFQIHPPVGGPQH